MESEEIFTLSGAGEHDFWIMVDGTVDTEMYLFSSDIVTHRYRNGPPKSETEPNDWVQITTDSYFNDYLEADSIDAEYKPENVEIQDLILEYVDDNPFNYTSQNPIMRKWLPTGTYYIRVQGAHKKTTRDFNTGNGYGIKIVAVKEIFLHYQVAGILVVVLLGLLLMLMMDLQVAVVMQFL